MIKTLITCMLTIIFTAYGIGAEKKPLQDVDSDEFTSDTQVSPKGIGDNHLALVWWIPNEFWESVLSRDETTSVADKKALLDAMSGISLLAVVQAEITSLGAFKFYTKEEVEKRMKLSFTDVDNKIQGFTPMQTISSDLEIVLGVFKPILGNAMGNLGNNMHFYVLSDRSKNSSRLLDPYGKGQVNIQLEKRDGSLMDATIMLPINALFVPRKCPNGNDAHITWKYCPWTGEKLIE